MPQQKSQSVPSASVSATPKVVKRKRPPPLAFAGDVGSTPQVVQIPGATGAVPGTTSATQTAPAAASNPIPASSGATPATNPIVMTGLGTATSLVTSDADPAPDVVIPTVPATFREPNLRVFKGFYPNQSELASMAGAVSDLARFVDYNALLGTAIGPAQTLANSITEGIKWRTLRDATETWDTYVRVEDALAWKAAMTLIDDVKPIFLFAAQKNASIATTYPALAKLFGAEKEAAKQGAATKAKKAKATATAKVATETAAATAATTTVTVTPSTTALQPKTVTVNT